MLEGKAAMDEHLIEPFEPLGWLWKGVSFLWFRIVRNLESIKRFWQIIN